AFVVEGKLFFLSFLLDADLPGKFLYLDWKINKTIKLVRFLPSGKSIVLHNSTGGFEFPERFSVTLKNLQEADSGLYAAVVVTFSGDKLVAEYKVTVQVELIVDRVDSSSSESCDLHVTCRTHNSHISSTFRCDDRVCSQEGGERSEVTTSGASLQVHLLKSTIICNHSNQVHWTQNFNTAEHLCLSNGKTERGNYYMIIISIYIWINWLIGWIHIDYTLHSRRSAQTRQSSVYDGEMLSVRYGACFRARRRNKAVVLAEHFMRLKSERRRPFLYSS
uniref:Immunoglobulin V-set domain-containing protein n=1 Tax=Gasterosteus aculeatus aculeatus TaxID=481459 RepID=A0AAQ4PNC9_GASAC